MKACVTDADFDRVSNEYELFRKTELARFEELERQNKLDDVLPGAASGRSSTTLGEERRRIQLDDAKANRKEDDRPLLGVSPKAGAASLRFSDHPLLGVSPKAAGASEATVN